ncbi:MAG: polysulfide reductase NrfD [Magnetospirillum sp.]|nr:polysulfide reductase NrfD [Magnetospirillum sp.]
MKKVDYQELTPLTPGWLAAVGGLAVVVAAAMVAVFHMEHNGHWVTGMSNQVVWGMPHVFAVFLIVAASGALNVASIGSVFGREPYQPLGRMSGLLAIALLAGGLAVLVLDLGRPDRLDVAMTHFNFKSIFAWNVILYTGFFGIVGAYLWTMMDWTVKGWYKPAAIAAFLWRLVLTTGTGSIFGFLMARELYGSAVMAPLFIAMSFAFGLAFFNLVILGLYAATKRPLGDDMVARLGKLLGVFIAANLYFVAVQHLTALYWPEKRDAEAFILLNGGIHTLLFWGGQVVIGGIVPLALLFRGTVGRCTLRFSSLLVTLGGLAQVFVIIVGGQSFPLQLFPGMEVSSSFFDGQVATYVPTVAEIVLGLGGIAITVLIVVIGATFLRFLPAALGETAPAAEPAEGAPAPAACCASPAE